MQNDIYLKGIISSIQYSHSINNVKYSKADLIVKNSNNTESRITLSFKSNSCPYKEGEEIELIGNLRSRTFYRDGKSHTQLYVFTYFDLPEAVDSDIVNYVYLQGNILKNNILRSFADGNMNLQFILVNTLDKVATNNYIPCLCWNSLAKTISKFPENSFVEVVGELRSRQYKKYLNASDFEWRVAHEVIVTQCNIVKADDEKIV